MRERLDFDILCPNSHDQNVNCPYLYYIGRYYIGRTREIAAFRFHAKLW